LQKSFLNTIIILEATVNTVGVIVHV